MGSHSADQSPDLLYVITDLHLGGVPLHLFRLAKAMRERGFRVVVVSLAPSGVVGDMLRDEGFEVRSCEACCGWDFRVMSRLAAMIRELNPRVVHSFLFHANLAAKFAAQSVGFPASRLICEIQTVEVERNWHLWVDRRTFDLCRFTIGNSPSVVEHLHVAAGIPSDRLRLVCGGIDVNSIQLAEPTNARALGLPSDAKIIFWAGRLDPIKGLDHLIDAVAVMNDAIVHLVLAGDGPIRGELQAQVDAMSLTPRVHFLGPRRDIPSLLKACDVFAFPSRTEGLPNALLEAMAAGCAIVATDVPGNRDLIQYQISGYLVPYGDTAGLAGHLQFVLANPDLRAQIRRGAIHAVETHWRLEHTIESYAAMYLEVTPVAPKLNPNSQAQIPPADR